ncbi:MAG: ABC transporter substrate-binding protein [Firmicutes bacterium]|nr:ABC transporter substrate-binding protein [Bacillota bacterium]
MVKSKFILMLLLFALVAGCGGNGTVEQEEAVEPVDLSIAAAEGVAVLPLLVAREMELFLDQGIRVELIKAGGVENPEIYLCSGAADGALSDLFSLIRLQEQGFFVMATSLSGADYLLAAAPEKSGSFAALHNVPVALSDDLNELYLLEKLLREHELDLTAVQLAIASRPEDALAAYLEERAAAAFLPRHLAAQALAAGAVVMGGGEEEKPAAGVILFTGEALQQKEDQIAAFYRAYSAAVRRLNEGLVDFNLLPLAEWGLQALLEGEHAIACPEAEAVSRDAFLDALNWYMAHEQLETRPVVYEGAVWQNRILE